MLFNILPGKKFEFLVNSKPSTDGAWTVNLEPLAAAAMSTLQYERWVDEHKQMVARLTNGEIALPAQADATLPARVMPAA